MADDLEEQFKSIRQASKFRKEDAAYLAARKEFSSSLGRQEVFSLIDHFGLYIGEQTLATKLAVYEIVKDTIDVPGHIMEFGVWNGSNLMFMAKALTLLQPNSTKQVIGFDTFEGLQTFSPKDGEETFRGRYSGNEETLRRAIALYGMNECVHIVKGDAVVTIPAFEKAFPETMVSLAYIDFDLYEPCKAALDFLQRHLSVGGTVVFDEANSSLWPGEGVALLEFIHDNCEITFEMRTTRIARQPTVYLVRK